jgi:hypothetical protein
VRYNNNGTLRQIAQFTLQVNQTWTSNGTFDANGSLLQKFLYTGNLTTLSSYEALPQLLNGPSDGDNFRTDSIFMPLIFPVNVTAPVAVRHMNYLFNGNDFSTNAGAGSQTITFQFALYTRGTKANSTLLSLFTSNSFSMAISVAAAGANITISQVTTTNDTGYGYGTTSSAGLNITSGYTGSKQVQALFLTTLQPNVYWIGVGAAESTAGNTVGVAGQSTGVLDPAWTLAPMGTVAQTTGSLGVSWHWPPVTGTWSASTAAWPSTMALTDIFFNGNAIQQFSFATTA